MNIWGLSAKCTESLRPLWSQSPFQQSPPGNAPIRGLWKFIEHMHDATTRIHNFLHQNKCFFYSSFHEFLAEPSCLHAWLPWLSGQGIRQLHGVPEQGILPTTQALREHLSTQTLLLLYHHPTCWYPWETGSRMPHRYQTLQTQIPYIKWCLRSQYCGLVG